MARREMSFGIWPTYSAACQRDVVKLLRAGGSLSAYRSNPDWPIGPTEGSWAWRLEREAEAMFNITHVIACNSGTMALEAAIQALDLPVGGDIISTPYTFSATVAAIMRAGHTPIFADVEPTTGVLDAASVGNVVTASTRAILPVDLFGQVARYDRYGFECFVIQDACQAVGAWDKYAIAAGKQGSIAAFSFNGGKNIPAGEAGAIATDNSFLATRARLFISHGENFYARPEIMHARLGINGRINEVTACIATHGLRSVLARNKRRRELARILEHELSGLDLILPVIEGHALYVYPLILPVGQNRTRFVARLRSRNIEVGEGYIEPPLHHYPAFRAFQRIPLPVVEDLSANRLCLFSQVRPPARNDAIHRLGEAIRWALSGV